MTRGGGEKKAILLGQNRTAITFKKNDPRFLEILKNIFSKRFLSRRRQHGLKKARGETFFSKKFPLAKTIIYHFA
jgi:hypothetical protein